jgi:hypothetical protein
MAPRGDGRPKRPRHVNLSDDQYEALNVISAHALGHPTLSSLIREAVDRFVREQMERDSSIAAAVQGARKRRENIVPIRTVKGDG